jgi:hypothetical protein
MRIASGKIVGGRVELDAELLEGTAVTVLALDGDETFEADAETEKMLLEAIEQCDRRQVTPMADLLSASVTLVACWAPSRRAAAVDPIEAPRCE